MYYGHLHEEKHGANDRTHPKMVQIFGEPNQPFRASSKTLLRGVTTGQLQHDEKQKDSEGRVSALLVDSKTRRAYSGPNPLDALNKGNAK